MTPRETPSIQTSAQGEIARRSVPGASAAGAEGASEKVDFVTDGGGDEAAGDRAGAGADAPGAAVAGDDVAGEDGAGAAAPGVAAAGTVAVPAAGRGVGIRGTLGAF
ncbi:MAG TPA: hypothetical protein VEA81_05015, partial [Burkholderiaceae bacterium]|nr:hypothetical protein [Burkholderiaceae bacterium]